MQGVSTAGVLRLAQANTRTPAGTLMVSVRLDARAQEVQSLTARCDMTT